MNLDKLYIIFIISTQTDTHMGIMNKFDYEEIVATVERMKMNEKIFFF